MKAEILAIGTELLLGQIVDTNSAYISQRLAELGIDVHYKTAVGDNRKRILAALGNAYKRADLVLATGGLGPTVDDLTKQTFAEYFRMPLYLNSGILKHIKRIFKHRKTLMPLNNENQAWVPKGAQVIWNPLGTAPGFIFEKGRKTGIILPGVPREMEVMLQGGVIPYLMKKSSRGVILSRVLKCCGITESAVDEKIKDLFISLNNPTLALLANHMEVKIRVTAKAGNIAEAKKLINKVEIELKKRLGQYIFGTDNHTMAMVVGDLLRKRRQVLSVAESCTGGLVANWITNSPGSSDYFDRAVITYSNQSKRQLLGVPSIILKKYGAVSHQAALAMGKGCPEDQ